MASATLCTYDPYPGTCAGSSMDEDPGIGTLDPGCHVLLHAKMNLVLTCGLLCSKWSFETCLGRSASDSVNPIPTTSMGTLP